MTSIVILFNLIFNYIELNNQYQSALIISNMSPDIVEQFWKYLFLENLEIYNQAHSLWIIDHRNPMFFLDILDSEERQFSQLKVLNEILIDYAWWDLQTHHPDEFIKVIQQIEETII
jgi:hypothetical protein